jgi:eukaryotic-like serine/threonine-protein kinase
MSAKPKAGSARAAPNPAQARADRKPENDRPSSEREQMSSAEIGGRYRLEGRLGYGGMSTVHLALDLRLERQVAVKLLAEHLAEDPTFISRFQREAQAAARLVHPNIVQVFDSGQDESTGQYFIVMEYIQGQSCAEILRDDGWLDVDEAISIIDQACEGLHYAHRHGVVHRDVKPGNLLRAREGEVKLADFGIAKATEQSSITQVGSVLGTAAYLAPEQARGEDAGPRADLYALGVVTYQLISGRLPYEAASLTELALKQQQEEPPLLDTLVAAVTPQLAEAVAVSLALDPLERYQTAREMGRALSDGANGIAPGERPAARRQAPVTEATSVLNAGRPTGARDAGRTAATNVTPRRPRSGPPRRAPAAAHAVEAQQPPTQGRGRRRGRLLGALVALLVLVVIVVAIVVATAPGSTQIRLRNVVYSDVQQASTALKELVSENTK